MNENFYQKKTILYYISIEYKERKKRLFSIYKFYQFMVNYQYSYVSCAPGVSPDTGLCADLYLTNYNTVKKKNVPFLDPYGISNNMTNFDIYMNVTKTAYVSTMDNVLTSARIKCDSNVSNPIFFFDEIDKIY
jgi:hypothetical protein